MSAQPVEVDLDKQADGSGQGDDDQVLVHAPDQVEVRRNAAVSAVVGVAASAIAIAYLWRAADGGSFLDWTLCLVLGAIAVTFFRGLLDARLPLLVADEMGVRVRLGSQWRGLPWEAIDSVVVKPRHGLLHDGRVVVTLHHVQRAVEGLEGRARRHAVLNQKMYGAVLAVPLGITTRVTGAEADELSDRVASLSQGRAEVVTLLVEAGPVVPASRHDHEEDEAEERPVISDDTVETRDRERRSRWRRREEPVEDAPAEDLEARVDGGREDEPVQTSHLRDAFNPVERPAAAPAATGKVRAIAKLGEPVAPLVIGDFEPEPAYDPVIGPELAAARTRVGLSVDELADRTRIRPHVIESIEVDDFTPCGGDFYARGHIRTLARVLGKDPAPLLASFEARYATAPVNARRVFEAELATGMTGSMRSTTATGPHWMLLIGVVLSLVLVWSAVRLFAGTTGETLNPPPSIDHLGSLNGSNYRPLQPPPKVATTLTAANGGAHVTVRDVDGTVVLDMDLALGQSRTVRVDPPVTVSSDDGGAVSVSVGGADEGLLGQGGSPATQVFQRPTS
jgi:cytoskeletal protein RodZ